MDGILVRDWIELQQTSTCVWFTSNAPRIRFSLNLNLLSLHKLLFSRETNMGNCYSLFGNKMYIIYWDCFICQLKIAYYGLVICRATLLNM